jgi:hypothetical protein
MHLQDQTFDVWREGMQAVEDGIGNWMIVGLAVWHSLIPGCLTPELSRAAKRRRLE